MIVVDSSAMVEALVGRRPNVALRAAMLDEMAAPHLLDVEFASALRGLTLAGKVSPVAAHTARAEYFAFSLNRYEFAPLAERVWDLRHGYTSYDATYLALAEQLGADLLTCDRKLAAGGHRARIRLIPSSD